MHSKSKNKLIEEIAKLSDQELFRSLFMAFQQRNFGLIHSLGRELPTDKQTKLSGDLFLFMQKVNAIQSMLLSKAMLAVAIYNNTFANLLKVDQDKPTITEEFIQERISEQKQWIQEIRKIDSLSQGTLELDELSEMMELENFFEYWQKLFSDLYKDKVEVRDE